MTYTFSETDKAVQTFLNSADIKYSFQYMGAHGGEWPHDLFTVYFGLAYKEAASFEYSMGIGHRTHIKNNSFDLKTKAAIDAHREALGIKGTSDPTQFPVDGGRFPQVFAHAPSAASVLYSLISDMDSGDDTFAEFCDNCGYDKDSIKANKIYLACQENGTKIKKTFTSEQRETLRELLQDY